MTAKKNAKQLTTGEWPDSLGQTFRPGDLVAVATISGKSPQMVIARVERINTTNPQGVPHTVKGPTGKTERRTNSRNEYVGPPLEDPYKNGRFDRAAYDRNQALQRDPANLKLKTWEYDHELWAEFPAVTVTATPLVDGRGFSRSDPTRKWFYDEATGESGYKEIPDAKPKAVTYTIVNNMIRLPDEIQKLVPKKQETAAEKRTRRRHG